MTLTGGRHMSFMVLGIFVLLRLLGSQGIFFSKQELYFLKDNYEIFSTEVSAREKQGQNSGGPHQGVIGSLGISSAIGPF